MTQTSWRASVVSYIRAEAQPADKFGHQPRLYALSSQISEGEDCDDDVLFAAAWMHDLGVFVGHRPSEPAELASWDHVPYTVEATERLLGEWGFPAEKVGSVSEVIRTHQPKDEPLIREAVVLRDADILEQLGAIGTLRSLVKVGRDTRYTCFSDVVPVLEQALRELPQKLRLDQSRRLAEERVRTMQGFLSALRCESAGLLY